MPLKTILAVTILFLQLPPNPENMDKFTKIEQKTLHLHHLIGIRL